MKLGLLRYPSGKIFAYDKDKAEGDDGWIVGELTESIASVLKDVTPEMLRAARERHWEDRGVQFCKADYAAVWVAMLGAAQWAQLH